MKSLPQYMRDFCLNMVTNTIKERENKNTVRKDLIQYLIQLRNNSESKSETDEWKINASGKTLSKIIKNLNPYPKNYPKKARAIRT